MFKDYFRLTRPFNSLSGCVVVILSAYVSDATKWLPVIMAAITVLLINSSTNAWNDYLDIEIDRINKPERPIPAGLISPLGALIFAIVGSALSLITAIFVNQIGFIIAVISNIILYLYSWKLKCTVLLGNATVAFIVALCFIFGGIAAGNIQPTLILALSAFFAMIGREILLTMVDYKGDLKQNCNTISTVWGKKAAGIFVAFFLLIASILMISTYFIQQYNLIYLYLVLFIMCPIFAYISYTAWKNLDKQILEKSGQLMKFSYFVWFLAIALGHN